MKNKPKKFVSEDVSVKINNCGEIEIEIEQGGFNGDYVILTEEEFRKIVEYLG